MNKQFMVKMLKAKQLQYEAMKEIMPEPIVNRFTKLENELCDVGKELLMSVLSGTEKGHQAGAFEEKKTAHKVTIE